MPRRRPASATPSPNLRANGETSHLSPRVLMREAAKVVADLGLTLSPARVRLLIDRYVRDGSTDVDFRTWFLGYADPTGDTAVRNVLRGVS